MSRIREILEDLRRMVGEDEAPASPEESIKFKVKEPADGNIWYVEFEIGRGGVLPRSDVRKIADKVEREVLSELDHRRGVVFSGRGPVWFYTALTHLAHPFAWVGTFEPREGGAVVTQKHRPDAPEIGDLIPIDVKGLKLVSEVSI